MAISDELHAHYRDLSQKAEYLLIGLIAASLGFFWQIDKPAKLGFNPSTLHLAALLILMFALIAAMARVHFNPGIFAYMSEQHRIEDEHAALLKSVTQKQDVLSDTFGRMTPQGQVERMHTLVAERDQILERINRVQKVCGRFYAARNFLLVTAYLLFLAERVWIPYSR